MTVEKTCTFANPHLDNMCANYQATGSLVRTAGYKQRICTVRTSLYMQALASTRQRATATMKLNATLQLAYLLRSFYFLSLS